MEGIGTCSICSERYDENDHLPLMLECGHTYCRKCLLTACRDLAIAEEQLRFKMDQKHRDLVAEK